MRSPFVWTLRFTARVCRKLGAVGVRGALLADITRGYPAASWRMADQRPMVPAPLYGHVGTGRDSGNDSSDCGTEVCARTGIAELNAALADRGLTAWCSACQR